MCLRRQASILNGASVLTARFLQRLIRIAIAGSIPLERSSELHGRCMELYFKFMTGSLKAGHCKADRSTYINGKTVFPTVAPCLDVNELIVDEIPDTPPKSRYGKLRACSLGSVGSSIVKMGIDTLPKTLVSGFPLLGFCPITQNKIHIHLALRPFLVVLLFCS